MAGLAGTVEEYASRMRPIPTPSTPVRVMAVVVLAGFGLLLNAACAGLQSSPATGVRPRQAALQVTRLNHLIDQIERGRAAMGTVNRQAPRSADAARALAARDLDFAVFDVESGTTSVEQVKASLLALREGANAAPGRRMISPLVRIPLKENDAPDAVVKSFVDIGAFGIMFGHIDTRARAERAVAAMRYHHAGTVAGPAPGPAQTEGAAAAAALWGLSIPDYLRRADVWPINPQGELIAIMMIESLDAIRNVNEIAQVPGVGALFFGPGDYGRSIGKPSRLPNVAPETEAAIQTMLQACRAHHVFCGYPVAGTPEALQPEADRRLSQGFKIVTMVNLANF